MRAVEAVGASVDGLDLSYDLAVRAGRAFVGELPQIAVKDDSYDGVYCVLTLEHVVDHRAFFKETARVTKTGGVLAVLVNHPVWTAPDATPITDQFGEVLWRPGDYFSLGFTEMPAGDGFVVFQHRSMAELLNAAASAGWSLESMVEQPHHEFHDQEGIPRLMAVRWSRKIDAG
jgi:ubiquinone/menaquinone biosynthesis C-methylase UbiE